MTSLEFTDNYAPLKQKLYAFALKLTRNVPDADDLMQETVIRAFAHRNSFQINTNFKAWITTIMRNTFSNKCRSRKRRKESSQGLGLYEHIGIAYSVLNLSESNMMMNELIAIVERLDEKYKIPFLMSYQGFEYQEIADRMAIPVGTVKSRLHTARHQLRAMVRNRYPQEALAHA